MLLGIAIAFVWRTSRFLHRHPSSSVGYVRRKSIGGSCIAPVAGLVSRRGVVISEEPQNLSCVLVHNWTYFHPLVWSTERLGEETRSTTNADSLSACPGFLPTWSCRICPVYGRVRHRRRQCSGRLPLSTSLGNSENEYGVGIFVRPLLLFTSNG